MWLPGVGRRLSGGEMATVNTQSARILVVDDDPGVRPLIADILTLDGHEVDTAENGREALDRIAARRYDLIMSDLRMPELDGIGLYREHERQCPDMQRRVALVTGTTERPEYERFLADKGPKFPHK